MERSQTKESITVKKVWDVVLLIIMTFFVNCCSDFLQELSRVWEATLYIKDLKECLILLLKVEFKRGELPEQGSGNRAGGYGGVGLSVFPAFFPSSPLKGNCHRFFRKTWKAKRYVLISDNLQTMIPFHIKVIYKWAEATYCCHWPRMTQLNRDYNLKYFQVLSLWVGNISRKKNRFALPWRISWYLPLVVAEVFRVLNKGSGS